MARPSKYDHEAIFAMRQDGMTVREVADALGADFGTLKHAHKKWCTRHGKRVERPLIGAPPSPQQEATRA
jgi:hypothetical protein